MRRHPISVLLSAVSALCLYSSANATSLEEAEAAWLELRELRDRIGIGAALGGGAAADGTPLAQLAGGYSLARERVVAALESVPEPPVGSQDARALALLRESLDGALGPLDAPAETPAGIPACDYDAAAVAGASGLPALQQRMYRCFGGAATALPFGTETLDRLGVFARLAITPDPAQRESLWLALRPVWRAVNRDNTPASPYRVLAGLNAARLARDGEALGSAVAGIGVTPEEMQRWLIAILEAWRDSLPGAMVEPWDHAYVHGTASRALDARVPLAALREINDRFYAELGAAPASLNAHYDLAPRPGKDPVAFTDFGRRPRPGGDPGEPWVFAAYRDGGLGNLAELLHETGHAVHIAAIRTRPAFADWPDSDIFTEGVADLAALDLWQPRWQLRYLGAAADARDSARERLAPVMLDIAWALFERRMHAQPDADPNAVWSELTAQYLRIAPHPEHSWWAVRGQLVDLPGYMLNYAAGAVLVADLRARLVERGVPAADWYVVVSGELFRFGRERAVADVLAEFLGRPVSPQALLDEIRALSSPR